MKRGKDDDKITGPMFPRLHVNDTEKGGPRAPPRNKMALYEQLSVPTQRFNPSNASNLVPPSSSSQGNGLDRNLHFPLSVPTSTSSHLAENFHARQPVGATLNTRLPQLEQKKKVGDEDDFTVPIYVQSGPTYPGHSIKVQNVAEKDPKRSSSSGLILRQDARYQSEENPEVCISSTDHSVISSRNLSTREKISGLVKEARSSLNHEHGDLPSSNFSRLHDHDASSLQEFRSGLQPNDRRCSDGVESMRNIEEEVVLQPRSDCHSRDDHCTLNEPNNDSEYRVDKTCGSLHLGNADKSDNISEISMVDSISGSDVSPDDVVGIIGQKHFWKARKAIVNQQRVFAVQVFELHRLIKVQQLIAESPQILLEDHIYIGNSHTSLKSSPANKLPSEYVVKPLAVKRKYDSEKPNHNVEHSAENAVGKTSISSVKNGNQPSNYGPYPANPTPAPVATDSRMGPWSFHQSPGQQWLVPIMSPSEGLIFKPYPGPGFMGPACGPFGPTPMTGNFINPGYGVLPGGHGYFPPYGMPMMNPFISGSAAEQNSQISGPVSQHGQNGQSPGGGANFNMQHESSYNVPTQKSGATPPVKEFQTCKDTELQGSTASSPSERVHGNLTGPAAEEREVVPTAPVVQEGALQHHDAEQPIKVIKVVPHNSRSATEFVARIFQSIQEERKQYD